MTDQPLPLKPLNVKGECLVGLEINMLMQWCDVHSKPYYACKILEFEKLLAEKDSEIVSLRQGQQVVQEELKELKEISHAQMSRIWFLEDELVKEKAEIAALKAAHRGSQKDSMDLKIEEQEKIITEMQIQHSKGLYTPLHEMDRQRLKAENHILMEALEQYAKGEVPVRLIKFLAQQALDRVRGK